MHDFNPLTPPEDHPPENHPQLMIGKVASLYDITVQTLRHYDKIGLFRPEVINPETGYRYYSVNQLRQLEYILFLRGLQFSLPEIQTAMDDFRAGDPFSNTLRQRDAQINAQIEALHAMQQKIRSLLDMEPEHEGEKNVVGIRWFEPLRVYHFRKIPPLPVSHPEFPLELMESRKQLLGSMSAIQTDYSFGATVSLQDFRDSGQLRYNGIFLDPGLFGSAPPLGAAEFPVGYYATIRFDRNERRPEDVYQQLCQFLSDHHFRSDDVILECGLDPSFASISRLSELTELQVRIFMD